jgi:hypothetical protein
MYEISSLQINHYKVDPSNLPVWYTGMKTVGIVLDMLRIKEKRRIIQIPFYGEESRMCKSIAHLDSRCYKSWKVK